MLASGTTIGGYRIERQLGRGGMGRVYEAWQESLQRPVALKILNGDPEDSEIFRARFEREGRVQSAIVHPNIVAVYEAGEADGHMFIAMQLVRGLNLKELIQAGELTPERALGLLGQIADALDTAHAAGFTHRDVKPHNVLVDTRDQAFLADFGLTKTLEDSRGFTRTGQFVGSYEYISPEQINGKPATHASDIYSLTAILYECLCGEVPYPFETDAAILFAHFSGNPPKVTERRPEVSPLFDALIQDGMSAEPERRPRSADGLAVQRAYEALDASEASLTAAADAAFPPTMEPGSRLVPPESDPSLTVPTIRPSPCTCDRTRHPSRRRRPSARRSGSGPAEGVAWPSPARRSSPSSRSAPAACSSGSRAPSPRIAPSNRSRRRPPRRNSRSSTPPRGKRRTSPLPRARSG